MHTSIVVHVCIDYKPAQKLFTSLLYYILHYYWTNRTFTGLFVCSRRVESMHVHVCSRRFNGNEKWNDGQVFQVSYHSSIIIQSNTNVRIAGEAYTSS